MKQKQLLFCPGPVNVAENVKQAVMMNEIGHREAEFSALMTQLNENILEVFEIRNKSKYFSVIISGSGTAANETVLSSVVGDKTILIISNGEFGERLLAISRLHNKKTKHIRFEWGKHFDLMRIEKYLKTHKVDFIAMVHHETCAGLINPVSEVGKLAQKYKVQIILDTVSSAGAEKMDLENWNVAFCTTSASKALNSLSGVSIVVGKEAEFRKLKNIPPKTMYLQLYKFYYYAKKFRQTPNTPAVPLFFALNQALTNILATGVDTYRQRIADAATLLRNEMKALGLTFLIDEACMSNMLTTVKLPKRMSFATLRDSLIKEGIVIYDGKGPFKNKYFQVGNIGELSQNDIKHFLTHFKKTIRNHDHYHEAKPTKRRSSSNKKSGSAFSLPEISRLHFPITPSHFLPTKKLLPTHS